MIDRERERAFLKEKSPTFHSPATQFFTYPADFNNATYHIASHFNRNRFWMVTSQCFQSHCSARRTSSLSCQDFLHCPHISASGSLKSHQCKSTVGINQELLYGIGFVAGITPTTTGVARLSYYTYLLERSQSVPQKQLEHPPFRASSLPSFSASLVSGSASTNLLIDSSPRNVLF